MIYARDGKWVEGITPAQKLEFYSTGATLSNPKPKWDTVITQFPTDISNCIKPNGKHWDWDKIRYEYSKHNPKVSMEQAKFHVSKLLKMTIKNPRWAEAPELEEFPKDFSDAVKGNRWDYDVIAELYEPFGVHKDKAIAHFRALKVRLDNPKLGARVLRLNGSVISDKVSGTLVFSLPEDRPGHVLKLGRVKPNWMAKELLEHYDREDVFWALYNCLDIPFDILG